MSDDKTKNGEEKRQGEDFGTTSGTKESSPGAKKTPEIKKEETGKTETGAEDKGAKQ
jgi:hypothetical protein